MGADLWLEWGNFDVLVLFELIGYNFSRWWSHIIVRVTIVWRQHAAIVVADKLDFFRINLVHRCNYSGTVELDDGFSR